MDLYVDKFNLYLEHFYLTASLRLEELFANGFETIDLVALPNSSSINDCYVLFASYARRLRQQHSLIRTPIELIFESDM